MEKKTALITGGLGFLGHHLVEHIHRTTNWNIIIIDCLSYATKGFERIKDMGILHSDRLQIFTWDLNIKLTEGLIREIGKVDYIIALASETHVDNSVSNPVYTIQNNINCTLHMLELARNLKEFKLFIYFSTDEIFGPAPPGISYKENDPHLPTNPYSASKSASESLVIAYGNTFRVPFMILNSMNLIGQRQHPEKYVIKCINHILNNETILIHADPTFTIPGSRFYIHARNCSAAILFLIKNGKIGEKYNIRGEKEINNLEMAQMIAKIMNKELKYELVNYHESRPQHDQRYALNQDKLLSLGWIEPVDFDKSLEKTILWTLEHPEWLEW